MNVSQSVVHRPVVSASPGSLLKMQILGQPHPHPRPIESETGGEKSNLFYQVFPEMLTHDKLENHWFRGYVKLGPQPIFGKSNFTETQPLSFIGGGNT